MRKTFKLLILLIFISSYSYSAELKVDLPSKIKAVFDWTLEKPEDSETAIRYISNFIKAYDEFNPIGEYQIAIVSHGPEVLIFSKDNYDKYKDIVDKLESLNKTYGVKIYVCRNIMKALGLEQSKLQPFVEVVPAGVVELAVLQEEGYRLIPTVVHDLRKFKK